MTRCKKTSPLLAATLAALLTACGGGGSDDGPPPALTLQGVWDTTLAPGGDEGGAVVLEDGSFWAFSGDPQSSSFDTLYQGTVSVNGNALSSANLRAYALGTGAFVDATSVTGTLAANSFSLNATASGAVTAVAGARSPADASYNFDTPAQAADIQGSWTGAFSTGDSGTVTVQANGSFSSTTSAGCSFTGTATPRASGKNVFNITLSFGPAPCLLPNTAGSGIALASKATATEPAVLIVMATTPNRSAAALYLALKQ
jgi:hypothetical protein